MMIVSKYDYLIDERDGDGMTPLQLLACNPTAFHVGGTKRGSLKKFICSRMTLPCPIYTYNFQNKMLYHFCVVCVYVYI